MDQLVTVLCHSPREYYFQLPLLMLPAQPDYDYVIGNGSRMYLEQRDYSRVEPKGKVCIRNYTKKNVTKYKILPR